MERNVRHENDKIPQVSFRKLVAYVKLKLIILLIIRTAVDPEESPAAGKGPERTIVIHA